MRSFFRFSRRPHDNDKPLTYEDRLRLDLQLAKWELENAYAGFDYVTDPDLVDCYIFQLNAAMKRYKYLLNCYNSIKKDVMPADAEVIIASIPAPQAAMPAVAVPAVHET